MTPSDVHCVSKTLKSSKQTTRSLAFFSNIAEVDHELRGSASPVLMAAGLDNGRFSTPQNPHPLTDDQKICYRWLRRQPLRLCQLCYKSVHGVILGKNNENFILFYLFIYLYLSRELTYRSDQSTDFHDWWLNDTDSRKGVPFGFFVDIASHFGGWNLQKPKFLRRE